MISFAALLTVLIVGAASVPVDPVTSDEVELITPKRTFAGNDDYDNDGDTVSDDGAFGGVSPDGSIGGFPIIIVRADNRDRNPFFSFPGFFRRPVIVRAGDADDDDEDYPGDDHDGGVFTVDGDIAVDGDGFSGPNFDPFFGQGGLFPSRPSVTTSDNDGDNETSAPANCGLICQILKGFESQIKEVQADVDRIKKEQEQKENEIDDGEETDEGNADGSPVRNSTYTEEVLPDGTIVRLNRTVITDTNDDGTSFFFHSTSFHNVQGPDDDDQPATVDDDEETISENDQEEQEETPEDDDIPLLTTGKDEEEETNDTVSVNDDEFGGEFGVDQ